MTSFPWNIETDQRDGWDRRDLMMDHIAHAAGVHSYFNFNFHHVLSRVRVVLRSNAFTDADFEGATVTLSNFILGGSANMATGQIAPVGTVGGTINPYVDVPGREFSAIVMPQTIAAGTDVVSVKLAAYPNPFTGEIPKQLVFQAGYITTIYIDLELTEIELSATLEEWKENGSGTIIIQ